MTQQQLNKQQGDSSQFDEPLVPGGERARQASASAGKTLENVDATLGDNNSLYNAHGDSAESLADREAAVTKGGSKGGNESNSPRDLASAEGDVGSKHGLFVASGAAAGISAGRLQKLGAFVWGTPTRKRATISSSILGLAVGGGFFALSVVSGPLQIIHYGQLLSTITPFQHQNSASDDRMGRLLRWARTSNVGETRLSFLGSKYNAVIQADFAKEGLQINTDSLTGQIKSVTLDTSKNPRYQGLSDAEARAAIAADNGVPLDSVHKISGVSGYSKFAISAKNLDITTKRGLARGIVSDQNLGKIATWIRFRILTRYYNIPSWLHPLKRFAAATDQKIADSVRVKELKQAQEDRLKALSAKSDAVKSFNESIRSKLSPGVLKTVGGALVATTAICLARDVAHDVPEANRLNVVVPSIVSAGDGIALGAQAATGQDVSIQTLGAVESNFTAPDGTTPWNSAGIQRLEGHTSGGVVADPGIAQAFSPDSNAAKLETALNASGASALCNPIFQVAQAAAGVALLFTGAGGLVEKGVQLGISFGVGIVIGQLTQNLTKILSDAPLTGIPHQGATGGNVDALGSVALADSSAVSMGSVQLTPAQTAVLDSTSDASSFASQSLANRLFNIHDYRSLASRVIDAQKPGAAQNMAALVADTLTSITHIGSAFSGLASMFSSHAQAAPTTPYGLGIPEFGVSASDLANPLVADPYANAEAAAQLLDSNQGSSYIDKASTCFGVTISKDAAGKWGALGTSDVNVASSDYTSANCGDTSDNWLRVKLFIRDTSLMEGYTCYKGDAQSCTNSGFNN